MKRPFNFFAQGNVYRRSIRQKYQPLKAANKKYTDEKAVTISL